MIKVEAVYRIGDLGNNYKKSYYIKESATILDVRLFFLTNIYKLNLMNDAKL